MRKIEIKNKWKFESRIGWSRSWWSYYTQYREAIHLLIEKIEDNQPVDTLALPVLFLIRHSLELGLKANILELQKVSSASPQLKLKGSKSHELEHLYTYFVSHLDEVTNTFPISSKEVGQIDYYKQKLVLLKDRLCLLDKGSYAFRYPVNTSEKANFSISEKLNIADIMELWQEVDPFILYTIDVLEEYGALTGLNEAIPAKTRTI